MVLRNCRGQGTVIAMWDYMGAVQGTQPARCHKPVDRLQHLVTYSVERARVWELLGYISPDQGSNRKQTNTGRMVGQRRKTVGNLI